MYLKAVEIQGFKSFPEKVRLSFEKDITAIVGPNGSGKSNISDAVSWVMGEQRSKALRGSKMEDVIFGGAEQRSQLSFAQVSLILDNEKGFFSVDSQELMITRRYYRSGENEYYINKKIVRLKDINEVLMDTGLGRDGYSIISQGKVDEILSLKSEDRREIFEEAAGISKYRYRKEESERKLSRTDESLLRISDKIAELELQVKPLREQAETAKKYLILRDELRELEISLWMEALDKLQSQSAKLFEDFSETSRRLDEEKRNLETLYLNSSEFSEHIREKDIKAEQVRAEISETEAKAAEFENEIAVLKTNIRNNSETAERLQMELDEQQSRDESLSAQINQRRERVNEIDKRLSEIAESLRTALSENEEASGAAGRKEAEINALLKEAADFESAAAAQSAKAEVLEKGLGEIGTRLNSTLVEIARLEETIGREKDELEYQNNELQAACEEMLSISNVLKGYEMRLETRSGRVAAIEENRQKLRLEQNSLGSRLSLLRDMEKEYEGFSRAVKLVMRESGRRLKNIHGTVASLIKTEDKYTVAIETALGSSLQSIVVEREEDGKAAISFLKQTDGGRATFLPVSAIRGNELNERGALNEKGVLGIASRLVSYDAKYTGVFQNQLGRTLIADTMDTAIRVSRGYSSRFRIVTLDGQIINQGGSMTGGSAARNVGILSRANEIERLNERGREIENELKEMNLRYAEAEREHKAAQYELETAGAELQKLKEQRITLESGLAQKKLLISSLEDSVNLYRLTENEVSERIKSNNEEIFKLREQIESGLKEARARRDAADALAEGQSGLKKKLDELSETLSALKGREASLFAEREAVLGAIKEWEIHLENLSFERERKLKTKTDLYEMNQETQRKISETQAERDKLRENAAREKEALAALLREKLEIEGKRGKTEKDTQEKNQEIVLLEREYSRLEQKKLAAELEEKQILDKLWDTYELSRTAAQRIRLELPSSSKAQRRAGELKREISALGTPNLGSIEEFERVNTRYTYLCEQRDDITKAKNELERIIRDITSEMRDIFAREFKTINESFKETFNGLFGGGRAELLLEDEDDILNCGIEIKVQPPGKTLRSLSLLSGGERAFVAIAIYFAIMKVRPTPFCVLDEIETALDEKNVQRFALYLRKMSHKTQFLVITHRRGTMEEADVLFGVTMQKGISKVLSIDLEEALKRV